MSSSYRPSPEELGAYHDLVQQTHDDSKATSFADILSISPADSVQIKQLGLKVEEYRERAATTRAEDKYRHVDALIKEVITQHCLTSATDRFSLFSLSDARNLVYESGVTEEPDAYHGLVLRYWSKRFEGHTSYPIASIPAVSALRMTTEITTRVFVNLRGYTRGEEIHKAGAVLPSVPSL